MNDDEVAARRQARDQGIGQVASAFGTRAPAHTRGNALTKELKEEKDVVTPWMTGPQVEDAAAEAGTHYWPAPGLIPPLTSLLFGDPKAGKTTVALDVAWNVASGNPTLGGVHTHQGDVLYVAAETGSPELDYMRRDMWPGEDWPARLALIPLEQYGRLGMPLSEAMDMWHEQAGRPTLVIIDTLGKVILGPAERRSPGSSMYAREYAAMERLTQWASKNRCAVVALHHSNQVQEKNRAHWSHAASGTAGLLGAAEDYMYLERRKAEEDGVAGGLRLRAEGRSFMGEQDWTLVRSGRNLVMFDTIELSERHGSKMREVAECALEFFPTVTLDQICDRTGLGRPTVRVYCKRLVDKGFLERVGDGEFAIAKQP